MIPLQLASEAATLLIGALFFFFGLSFCLFCYSATVTEYGRSKYGLLNNERFQGYAYLKWLPHDYLLVIVEVVEKTNQRNHNLLSKKD